MYSKYIYKQIQGNCIMLYNIIMFVDFLFYINNQCLKCS